MPAKQRKISIFPINVSNEKMFYVETNVALLWLVTWVRSRTLLSFESLPLFLLTNLCLLFPPLSLSLSHTQILFIYFFDK